MPAILNAQGRQMLHAGQSIQTRIGDAGAGHPQFLQIQLSQSRYRPIIGQSIREVEQFELVQFAQFAYCIIVYLVSTQRRMAKVVEIHREAIFCICSG